MKGKRRVIVAAGTVTVRQRKGREPEVLLVHRPSYDDWSLPKGHLEPDEYLPVAAVRETREETASRVTLREPVGSIRYKVSNGTKVVHYWRGVPGTRRRHKPDKEVDKVAWLTAQDALARLTYADERPLVEGALGQAPTTPFIIVRHAKAMDRKNWSGRDQSRPITARGRKQSRQLIPLLEAYGVTAVHSSSSTRCMQTLLPFARRHDLDLTGWAALTEEVGEKHPDSVTSVVQRLAREAAASQQPTVLCGHRPVLPMMLDALDVPSRPFQTASAQVLHLDADGRVVAHEFHRALT